MRSKDYRAVYTICSTHPRDAELGGATEYNTVGNTLEEAILKTEEECPEFRRENITNVLCPQEFAGWREILSTMPYQTPTKE